MQKTNKSKNSMRLLLRGCTVLLKVSRRYAIFLVLLNIANGFIDPLNAIVYQKLLDSIVYVLKEGKMQNTCFVLIALLALLSVTAFILNGFVELVKRNYIDKIDLYVTESVLEKTLSLPIARCVYRQGIISILDEPFSSIDAESESNIITRLRESSKNNLTIFITHRFSSISLSDQIVVLKGGKIAEQGTHDELLQHGSIYYRLYSSQKLS